MNSTIHKINLDIHRIGAQVYIPMVYGDTERTVLITLMEKGKLYKIAEGCTAKFSAKKPDGNYIYNNCVVDYANNCISYDIGYADENGTRKSQTTSAIGDVECQIKLIASDGGIISTPSFTIVVSPTVYNEQEIIESSSEYNALTEYVADLERKLNDEEFYKGEKGDDYILTDEDKVEISNLAIDNFNKAIGDIESALDSIIAIQNELIGGDAE